MKNRVYNTSRSAVIQLLLERGSCSRIELARLTGLSRAAISLTVNELLADGLAHEAGTRASTGGRKPILVQLGGGSTLVAGVAFEASRCVVLITGLGGETLDRIELADVSPAHCDEAIAVVRDAIGDLMARHPGAHLLGCGIAIAGTVDARTNAFCRDARGLPPMPLHRQFESALKCRVSFLEIAHAAALGEFWLVRRNARADLVYLYLGDLTGGAIIAGSELHLGRNRAAGELGAMIVDPNGPDFGCHTGCLEGYVRSRHLQAIVQRERDISPSSRLAASIPPEQVIAAIGEGVARNDHASIASMRYVARHVGLAVSNLISVLNPDDIVLGGPLGVWGDAFATMVMDFARQTALPTSFDGLTIRPGHATLAMIPLGAAAAIIQQTPVLLARSARRYGSPSAHSLTTGN